MKSSAAGAKIFGCGTFSTLSLATTSLSKIYWCLLRDDRRHSPCRSRSTAGAKIFGFGSYLSLDRYYSY